MKHHAKQNSLQFKVANSQNSDAAFHKVESIARTFRKKTQSNDSQTISFLHQTPSTLNRYPTRENKKSYSKNSEQKSMQKKSQVKLSNEKSIERLKSIYKPAYEVSNMGIKSKLVKISHILMVRIDPEAKNTLTKLYDASSEYEALLKEWKRLDLFDELDELLKNLLENYLNIIEDLLHKSYSETVACIDRYQQEIKGLQKQNGKLKSLLEYQTNKFDVQMLELEKKVYEEYQKNQWATFIFNELSLHPFDLQYFIKNSEIYKKARSEYQLNDFYRCRSGATQVLDILSKDTGRSQKNNQLPSRSFFMQSKERSQYLQSKEK